MFNNQIFNVRYAYNDKRKKIEVGFSGENAICPDCNSLVIGRKGKFKVKHWSHKSKKNCDSWHEPISEWHVGWQNRFPRNFQEITLEDESKTKHRADVLLNNNLVIEIQNSPIKISEIEDRERFYGRNGMIWVLNGENLAKNSKINYKTNKKLKLVSIKIPDFSEYVDGYEMDEFSSHLFQTNLFEKLFNNPSFKGIESFNGNYFELEFYKSSKFNLYELQQKIDDEIKKTTDELYSKKVKEQFFKEFETTVLIKQKFENIVLRKKYWRGFIDEMKFPVFIDKISGLESELLYWYQKNKIIEKERFFLNI